MIHLESIVIGYVRPTSPNDCVPLPGRLQTVMSRETEMAARSSGTLCSLACRCAFLLAFAEALEQSLCRRFTLMRL
jgi:hypothetical protein